MKIWEIFYISFVLITGVYTETSVMTYDYYNMVTGQKDIKGGKCKGAIFGVENVPYQVKIQSYLNVKAIMVSDYVIKDCSDFNWDQCSQDSKYCQSRISFLRLFRN